jgi:hypothetical protein
MFVSRNKLFSRAAVTALILIYASVAFSQDEEVEQVEQAAVTTDEMIEEVIVYAYKPGDEIDMDARYAELFRTRAAAELDRMEVLNDEYEWRVSMSEDESESRIKWGYNPEAEMSMRRDTSLTELPTDSRVKPATLFRVQF